MKRTTDDNTRSISRRRALGLLGASLATALAGCSGQNSQGSQSGGDYDFEAEGEADNLSDENNTSTNASEATAAEARADDQPSDYATELDELELRNHDILQRDNYKGVVIEGLVENTGSERIKTAEVRARVYNDDDNLLGRYLASTNDLDPGMTWSFEVIVLESPEDVDSYDLAVVGALG